MHRAMVLARGTLLSTADFPIHLGQLKGEGRDAPASFVDRVSEFERALIVDALARAGGSRLAPRPSRMSERAPALSSRNIDCERVSSQASRAWTAFSVRALLLNTGYWLLTTDNPGPSPRPNSRP
jgi:hypothetical protein